MGGEERDPETDGSDDEYEDVIIGGQSGDGCVIDEGRWFSDSIGMDVEMVRTF